jgi:hypothetical protein
MGLAIHLDISLSRCINKHPLWGYLTIDQEAGVIWRDLTNSIEVGLMWACSNVVCVLQD